MYISTSSLFFFSSRRRHTRFKCDWSSDVCSSDLSCRLGGFPNLSRLVWYNCVGSKYDLTQRAAASAAASYFECGGFLSLSFEGVLLFRQFCPPQRRHPLPTPPFAKKNQIPP